MVKDEKLKVVALEPLDDLKGDKKEDVTEDVSVKEEDKKDEVAAAEVAPKVPEKDVKLKLDDDDVGPPPPARPVSPRARALQELKDAFPSIEEKYITAVLIASSGQLDPAFNALLYLSDPSFKPEIPISAASMPTGKISTQTNATLTDDEKLARRLQQEFEREEHQRRRSSGRRRREPERRSTNPEDSPDEFEQIKETFTQGLEEARSTLNGWVSGLAKKFDSNEAEQIQQQQQQQQRSQQQNRQNDPPKLFGALGGSSYSKKTTNRFDEDPVILSNDFNRISMNDNDNDVPGPQLPRRKTSHEQSDNFSEKNAPAPKKWQPLNSDAPVNSDAFLVNDSDEDEVEDTKKPQI